jgi:hypothetical protein
LTGTPNNIILYNDNLTNTSPNCRANPSFQNGLTCSNPNGWIRFAFNNMNPNYVAIINITNVNNVMASIPRLKKRLTHPFGNLKKIFLSFIRLKIKSNLI